MSNSEIGVPESLNQDLLTDHLVRFSEYADRYAFFDHEPDQGSYWKALDLVLVARHLSDGRVWGTDMYTGGFTLTPDRSRAERWMTFTLLESLSTLREVQPFTPVSFAPSRLLISLSDRVRDHTHDARHASREPGEMTATSAKLSDIDPTSRELMRRIFELPPDFDTEFVYPATATSK